MVLDREVLVSLDDSCQTLGYEPSSVLGHERLTFSS
jgi:hypothetical protein